MEHFKYYWNTINIWLEIKQKMGIGAFQILYCRDGQSFKDQGHIDL